MSSDAYVQVDVTGTERDRRTRKPYRWCHKVRACDAERVARRIRRLRGVAKVEIVAATEDDS